MLGSSFPNNAPVPFPLENDPNIWLWFDASYYAYVDAVGSPRIYTLGNRSTRQVDKGARTPSGTTNLVPGAGYSPFISRSDNKGNLCEGTVNGMTAGGDWSYANCTRNSASLITFTAQNGYARYTMSAWYHEGLSPMKVSVQIRRISGNTNLEIQTNGTYTPITISDTATTYTVNFTSPALGTSNVVGIRDPNASGHGQIECLYWSVRMADWDDDYIETTGYGPYHAGHLGRPVVYIPRKWMEHYAIGSNAFGATSTVYFTMRPNWRFPARILSLSGGVYNWFFSMENNVAGQYSMYTNSGTKRVLTPAGWIPDKQWVVITLTIDSGNVGTMRANLGAVTSGAIGTVSNAGLYGWGACGYDSYYEQSSRFTELIWRNKVDDAATQEAYVRYLAEKVGISL